MRKIDLCQACQNLEIGWLLFMSNFVPHSLDIKVFSLLSAHWPSKSAIALRAFDLTCVKIHVVLYYFVSSMKGY